MDLIKNIKKNYKNYLIGLLLVLFIGNIFFSSNFSNTGVSDFSSNIGREFVSSKSIVGSSYYPSSSGGFAPETQNRKIIKNANLNIETNNFDVAKAQTQNLVGSYNAIILSESESKNQKEIRTINYNIKVSTDKLSPFIDELKKEGEILSVNIYSNDVTKSFVDYNDRLNRYQSQIEKYKSYLSRESISIKEEIEIQNRIDSIENQIFYLKQQISNLDESSTYSTVNFSIKEKPSTLQKLDFLGFSDGVKLFFNSLENGVKFILMVLGFLIPFSLVWGIYRLGRKVINK